MPNLTDDILELPGVSANSAGGGKSSVEKRAMSDLGDDTLSVHLEEFFRTQESLLTESQGNVASANSVVRHSAARKFNQEDPIEAACAEMILRNA
jgi:hypothetical protein